MDQKIDTLSRYGKEFQEKTIALLITDKSFLDQIIDALSINFYDSEAKKWIVEKTVEYYQEYKKSPSQSYFKSEFQSLESQTLRVSVLDELRKAWNKKDDEDLQYVKDEFLNFAKNQRVKQAILDAVPLLKEGNYEKIKQEVSDALNSGVSRDIGHVYKKEIESRLSESSRKTVPTGWGVINEVIDGGLGPGELGVVVAPSGAGKCVGKNTEIEIEYEQVGFEVKGEILWLDPWEKFDSYEDSFSAWDLKNRGKTREINKKVRIGYLFDNIGVDSTPYATNVTSYDIRVKTPYGLKTIEDFFRTERQEAVTLYFENNETLECSLDHQLKVGGEWKKVKNIDKSEEIETDRGKTSLKRVGNGSEKKLYDISVEDVHCYYSNGILSHNSWSLCHLGLSAVKEGFNVLHYTLELDEDQTGLRYDSILSGYSPTEVREHKDEVMEAIGNLSGSLNIKQFPTKSASVQTLSSHFEKVQAIEGRPDVVLVDYADLLSTVTKKNNNSENTYLQMGNIYTQIRKMAGELQVPVWTVSQSRRDSIDKEVIQADMIADSYKKIMISDVVLSLSRTKSDKLSNTARFHFIKNRFGQDGLTFPSIMDTESGTIEVYDPDSQYGAEVKDKMSKSEGQAEMEALRDQYNDYKKRSNGEANSSGTSVEDLLESKKEEKKTNISV